MEVLTLSDFSSDSVAVKKNQSAYAISSIHEKHFHRMKTVREAPVYPYFQTVEASIPNLNELVT